MKPKRIEFNIGEGIYKNPVSLIWTHDYMGRESWAIIRHATSQRDDQEAVYGLTDENILKMAEAIKSRR